MVSMILYEAIHRKKMDIEILGIMDFGSRIKE